MRSVLAVAVLALAAAPAAAVQDRAAERKARQQADFKARYEARLKEPWLVDGGWIADYDRALEKAASEKKLILAYFTISFATSDPSDQIQARVFSTAEFREATKAHVLFVHMASRVEGAKHPGLLKEVSGGSDVPYVAALGPSGELLAVMESRTVDGMVQMMARGAEYFDLKSKKDPTPGEVLRILEMDFAAGRAKDAECRTRAAGIRGLDAAGLLARDLFVVHLDVALQLEKHVKMSMETMDPKTGIISGKVFAQMYRDGRIPKEKRLASSFFGLIVDYAEDARDLPLFRDGLAKLREHISGNRNGPAYLQTLEKRLAALEAALEKK